MLTLLLASACLSAPDRTNEVHAEAWVVADDPAALASARRSGLALAEGSRTRSDGRLEHRVLATQAALTDLRARGFEVRVDRADHRRGAPPAGYHTPEQGDALLAEVAASTSRAGLARIGTSVDGRPLTALWVGQHPDTPGADALRVLGAHHGDELSSAEVSLDVALTLVQRDGVDPSVTALLDSTTVWLVPFLNPDGVMEGSRFNSNGVDLNRNYDFEWSASAYRSGPEPFSEPETRAVRVAAAYDPPHTSLAVHSGEANIGYVWNYTTSPTPEEGLLDQMVERYADLCTTPAFWPTNGADWYVTHGDTNDWSYGRYGGMDFTLEVTRIKAPEASEIPVFTAHHREAILDLLTTPPALQGVVTDQVTGQPVPARLQLYRFGVPVSVGFTTDPVGGRFVRHIPPDDLLLRVEAPGFQTLQVPVPGEADLSLALERDGLGSGRPVPVVVSGDPVQVELPGAPPGPVTLWRPDAPPVEVGQVDGHISLDPAQLQAGAWSLVFDDGTTWSRALFVTDSLSRVDEWSWDGEMLRVDGEGFGEGTRAFGLWGELRPLVPLTVVDETVTSLEVDLGDTPEGETLDVILLSNGSQQAIPDVTRDPDVDTAAPDTGSPDPDTGGPDTGQRHSGPYELVHGGCGCGGNALLVSPWLLMVPLVVGRRRRGG